VQLASKFAPRINLTVLDLSFSPRGKNPTEMERKKESLERMQYSKSLENTHFTYVDDANRMAASDNERERERERESAAHRRRRVLMIDT
jgi:hypothetical protein